MCSVVHAVRCSDIVVILCTAAARSEGSVRIRKPPHPLQIEMAREARVEGGMWRKQTVQRKFEASAKLRAKRNHKSPFPEHFELAFAMP